MMQRGDPILFQTKTKAYLYISKIANLINQFLYTATLSMQLTSAPDFNRLWTTRVCPLRVAWCRGVIPC